VTARRVVEVAMGFFRKSMDGEEDSLEEGPQQVEEKYEKMFAKIGRDFIYKEDFISIMESLFDHLQEHGIDRPELALESDILARTKAVEYKDVVQSGDDGTRIYEDLIDMDS